MSDQDYQREAILEHMGSLTTFVETGSAIGETSAWAATVFEKVYTIEFQENYYIAVLQRFWDTDNVTCIRGDSAVLIEAVEWMLPGPTVFWLDGHYDGGPKDVIAPSGMTPVWKELDVTLSTRRGHVVLVDDARLFTGEGYPTLESVEELAASRGYSFENRNDVLRMLPL